MTEVKKASLRYSEEAKAEVLAKLAANGGNVLKTARETGLREGTIRRWRKAAAAKAARVGVDSAGDLHRFTEDAWRIIHKANQIVEEKVEELAAKDAASIASGYFDRQAKAAEQLNESADTAQEYVAQWDSDKS